MNINLPRTIQAWPGDDVKQVLKSEIESLPTGSLPLHEHTIRGGMVDDKNISVTVLSVKEIDGDLQAKVGIFFTEVVGGCNCHDDPAEENAYAELVFFIRPDTA